MPAIFVIIDSRPSVQRRMTLWFVMTSSYRHGYIAISPRRHNPALDCRGVCRGWAVHALCAGSRGRQGYSCAFLQLEGMRVLSLSPIAIFFKEPPSIYSVITPFHLISSPTSPESQVICQVSWPLGIVGPLLVAKLRCASALRAMWGATTTLSTPFRL